MLACLLGLPKQSEILIIIFLGICFLSLDFSLFEIRSNVEEIWKLELNRSPCVETLVKYIISAVVLIRTFTLHAFLAFYIVMLWPAIFEEKPNLMLPWLLLGIIRCLLLNVVTLIVGSFICQKEKGLSPICLEFIIAQVIEHGPSVYAWICVLSFYRDLAGEHHSNESSQESIITENEEIVLPEKNEEDKENDGSVEKSKSYSLSDINLDYMHSSRFRSLSTEMPMNVLLDELRHLISQTTIIRESKSSSSLTTEKSENFLEFFGNLSQSDLSIIQKTMKVLDISDNDVSIAREEKDRLIEVLKQVKLEDVAKMDEVTTKVTSPKFYIRKRGDMQKGIKTSFQKSHSHENTKSHDSCLCYLRRKLQKDQSKLTFIESEIANIKFDETEKDIVKINNQQSEVQSCKANCKSSAQFTKSDETNILNLYRVVVGASLGFDANIFLQKFVLKKNTSKNFGCQVSLLRRGFLAESKNELAKKLAFLRNFRLI